MDVLKRTVLSFVQKPAANDGSNSSGGSGVSQAAKEKNGPVAEELPRPVKYPNYHVIIADDKEYIRDDIQAVVRRNFNLANIHQAETVEGAVREVLKLKENGVSDSDIIVLSDYEFGSEQTGERRKDGRDPLNELRVGQRFKGNFVFVSGSIISRDQIPGYDRLGRDISAETKAKYGIEYMEKDGARNFPERLLAVIDKAIASPYTNENPEEIPAKIMSKPVNISFLNGGVNDYAFRMNRMAGDLSVMFQGMPENSEISRCLDDIGRFLNFDNTDRRAPFNVRVHNYVGKFLCVNARIAQIKQEMESSDQYTGQKGYNSFIQTLNDLRLTMDIASKYMRELLSLSSQLGNLAEDVSLEEFMQKTAGVFSRNYGSDILLTSNSDTQALADTRFPNALTMVVLYILDNALQQYRLTHETSFRGRISFDIDKDSGNLRIVITDQAGGIREDVLNKIFLRGFTTKSDTQGSGYGLFWAKQLVEIFGGTIDAENVTTEEKLGARFSISIPLRWREIVNEDSKTPMDQVSGILTTRGVHLEENSATLIARDIYKYSVRMAEVAKTRVVSAADCLDGNMTGRTDTNMLSHYRNALCDDSIYNFIFNNTFFEKGVGQKEIEDFLLYILSFSSSTGLDSEIAKGNLYLENGQIHVVKRREKVLILLRSKENTKKEHTAVTEAGVERCRKILLFYNDMGLDIISDSLWFATNFFSKMPEFLKGSSQALRMHAEFEFFKQALVSYDRYSRHLMEFADDICISEVIDDWQNTFRDCIDMYKRFFQTAGPLFQSQEDKDSLQEYLNFSEYLLAVLLGNKIDGQELIDIPKDLVYGTTISVMGRVRLWHNKIIVRNIIRHCPKRPSAITASEEGGNTVLRVSYERSDDVSNWLSSSEFTFLHYFMNTVGGSAVIENGEDGSDFKIVLSFPLPLEQHEEMTLPIGRSL